MNETRKYAEYMAEYRSAAHAAAFLQRLQMDSHGEFVYTGVRSDWMEQDGPAVFLSFAADAVQRLFRIVKIATDFSHRNTALCKRGMLGGRYCGGPFFLR